VSPAQVIDVVHKAGGIAVLAHPRWYTEIVLPRLDMDEIGAVAFMRSCVLELTKQGLDGLEVYTHWIDERKDEEWSLLAKQTGLVITGVDCHFSGNENFGMGKDNKFYLSQGIMDAIGVALTRRKNELACQECDAFENNRGWPAIESLDGGSMDVLFNCDFREWNMDAYEQVVSSGAMVRGPPGSESVSDPSLSIFRSKNTKKEFNCSTTIINASVPSFRTLPHYLASIGFNGGIKPSVVRLCFYPSCFESDFQLQKFLTTRRRCFPESNGIGYRQAPPVEEEQERYNSFKKRSCVLGFIY
jgi:hypothetical protein